MSETGTPWKKIIGIGTAVITPILIAVLTPIGEPIGDALKEIIFPTKIDLEGRVIKAAVPLKNLEVELADYPPQTTDSKGVFLFSDIRTGAHRLTIEYENELHTYNLRLGDEEDYVQLDPYDIGAVAIDPGSLSGSAEEELVSNIEKVSSRREEERPTQEPEAVAAIPAEPLESGNQQPEDGSLPAVDTPIPLSPNEILSGLSIKVYIDESDKSKSGKQKAYRYSLLGDPELLNRVKEARYIRNHDTFSEKANNTYQAGYEREDNFEFSGYQWGGVRTTYLCIVTVDGKKSDWVLKDLGYVK